MRNFTILLFVLNFITFSVYANSQVGTLKEGQNQMSKNTLFVKDISQIKKGSNTNAVYAIGRQNGITEIAVANAIDSKWEIQKYAVPNSVIENSEFSQFINQSTSVKEWVEIQK